MSAIYNSRGELIDIGGHDDAYYEEITKGKLSGKVMISLGDSYTVGMGSQLSAIATKYGMALDNRGVVGASVSWRATSANRRMPNMADTIVSDYSNGYTINGTTYHADDVAVITFMGGANDGSGIDAWLGTGVHETDKSTIYGSLNRIFSSFKETFTNATIICITQPSNYCAMVEEVQTDVSAQEIGFDDLAELQVFSDIQYSNYCQGMKEDVVKKCAWLYGIPVVDVFNEFPSVFKEENRTKYWASDKLHLTPAGYDLVAKAIEKKIVNLFSAE